MKKISLPAILLVLLICTTVANATDVGRLRTEHLESPLGIDNPAPRLSWRLEDSRQGAFQRSYQIQVSSDSLHFTENLVWDSGKIYSDSVLETYAGQALEPFKKYWWKVVCEDKDGLAIESPLAFFETGMMSQNNWKGYWISDDKDEYHKPSPCFRKEFTVRGAVKEARAYITAAGLYELQINGVKVGDRVLDPAFTRFDRRILYSTYDISGLINAGDNAVGVELGNAWYNHQPATTWDFDKAAWRARPSFCMDIRIRYADGSEESVSTDNSWKTSSDGPLIYNNIYTGEHYDARRIRQGWSKAGYDDSLWSSAILKSCPSAVISSQAMTPIREGREIEPVGINKIRPNRWVFDFGTNIAGNVHLRIKGDKGAVISLKYAERLDSDGRADQSNIDVYYFGDKKNEPFQTDIITLSGGEDEFIPKFSYKGFRYVEINTSVPIEFTAGNLKAVTVNSDVPQSGKLSCSSELINSIHKAARNSYLSNLMGYPTDCPQREKNGWTGDAHIAIQTGLYNFDAITVYEKWLADHRDEQQPNGVLPDIIPTCGWGYWDTAGNGNGLDWTSTIALIPWNLYLFYGDAKPLHDCYDNIRRYVDYALTTCRDGLTSWGRGDWVPVSKRSDKTLIQSCFLYNNLIILCKAAEMFGYAEDAAKYSQIAAVTKDAINSKFLNKETGVYAEGMQTDQSVPLTMGVVPAEYKAAVVEALVKRVAEDNYQVNAGVHGAKAVLNALSENGRADLAYRIASQKDYPSWGWWIENGRTALVENWKTDAPRDNSDNHIMFGDIAAWFYRSLGGINPDPQNPGFKHIILRPFFPKDLSRFECSYDSLYGIISSSWQRRGRNIEYKVTIPCSCSATLIHTDGSSEKLSSGSYKFIFKR